MTKRLVGRGADYTENRAIEPAKRRAFVKP